MSSGYASHPAAFADLDEIRAYVARNNQDGADRVIEKIFDTIRGLVPFPYHGISTPTLVRDLCGSLSTRIPDCLRTGRKAHVGRYSNARSPQPSHQRHDPERQRITHGRPR
jgi:plasmid stabilization system protein ParE